MVTGRKAILGDGQVLLDVEFGYSSGILWLYKLRMTINQAIERLNETRTSRITFVSGDMKYEYEGYTRIAAAMVDFDGTVKVALTQPDTE